MSKKRSRSEIFASILGELKARKTIFKSELCCEVCTDTELFNSIIKAMKEQGMIDTKYELTKGQKGPRQREVLIATENLDHQELQILALSKVLSPTLSQMFYEWRDRKSAHSEGTLTESQEKKIKSDKKFSDLFWKLAKETKDED